MRKEILLTFTLILIIASFSALHSANVQFSSLTLMETTTQNANLTINNYGSTDTITQVELLLNGFSVAGMQNYADWNESYTNTSAIWSDGSVSTNVLLALFELAISAPQVSANTTAQLSIITTDENGDSNTELINITIIDDSSAPVYSNQTPNDGDYYKQGSSNNVGINAVDLETGVSFVQFSHQRCSDNSSSQIVLSQSSNYYSALVDFSSYNDSDLVCFSFYSENNGGKSVENTGAVVIDGFAPTVNLDNPSDGAIVNAQEQFSFTGTDNLAPTLDCTLIIDGNDTLSITVNSSVQESLSAQNLTQGAHNWAVRCEDLAGHETTSSTRNYLLDKTSPVVNITPINGSIVAPTSQIDLVTTDNYAIDYTIYTYLNVSQNTTGNLTLNSSIFADGPNTITAFTTDTVGNNATFEFTIIVDSTAPVINSFGPNSSDVNVNFTIDVSDTWDNTIDCTVSVSDGTTVAGTLNSGVEGGLQTTLGVGLYNYSVICLDDAGNSITSPIQNLTIIDTSGPSISFNNPNFHIRGSDLELNTTITDVSGIASVIATLDAPDNTSSNINLTQVGDDYVTIISTDSNTIVGTYVLTIVAQDTYANNNSNSDSIEITYDIDLTLGASPATITLGQSSTLSGALIYDNGSAYPNSDVQINTSQGTSNVTTSNSSYSSTYTPSSSGTKSVSVSFTAANNVSKTATTALIVNSVSSSSSSGGSSSSGSGDSDCNNKWTCDSWSICANGEQERDCSNECSTGGTRQETRSCTVSDSQEQFRITDESSDSSKDSNNVIVICTNPGQSNQKERNIPESEWSDYSDNSKKGECPELDEGSSAIGQAGGFFFALNFSATSFMLMVLIIAGILGGLFFVSRKGGDEDDWDNYMNKRR